MVPREELHTCHIRKGKKKKQKQKRRAEEQQQQQQQQPVVPDLPNYFNNLDENNRLQDAKERSEGIFAVCAV